MISIHWNLNELVNSPHRCSASLTSIGPLQVTTLRCSFIYIREKVLFIVFILNHLWIICFSSSNFKLMPLLDINVYFPNLMISIHCNLNELVNSPHRFSSSLTIVGPLQATTLAKSHLVKLVLPVSLVPVTNWPH